MGVSWDDIFSTFLQEMNSSETRIHVPLHSLAERPCVQVNALKKLYL